MKILTYEEWCENAQKLELNRALKALQAKKPMEQILEEMSVRLINKLAHPLHGIVEDDFVCEYVSKESIKSYEDNYLNKVSPIADHVIE